MVAKLFPNVDYTLTVHEPDSNGAIYVTSSIPGLHAYGKDLSSVAKTVEMMVQRLRRDNGDERVRNSGGGFEI